MIYALDTNTVIHHLRNDANVRSKFDDACLQGHEIAIPKIVDYEMRRGFRISSAQKKVVAYDILIEELSITDLDNATWQKAEEIYADLYQKHFTVGDMDILIAAICLVNDYTLVTANTNDFINISSLKMVDWTI